MLRYRRKIPMFFPFNAEKNNSKVSPIILSPAVAPIVFNFPRLSRGDFPIFVRSFHNRDCDNLSIRKIRDESVFAFAAKSGEGTFSYLSSSRFPPYLSSAKVKPARLSFPFGRVWAQIRSFMLRAIRCYKFSRGRYF